MPVTRAIRHPAAGLGWLFLQPAEAELLERGGPPQSPPDPKQSGQNPEYTAWAWERTRLFAGQPGYLQQVDRRLAELDQQRTLARQAFDDAAAQLRAIAAERQRTLELLTPLEPEGDPPEAPGG